MKLYEDRTGSTPVTSSENSDDFSSTVPSVVSHLFFSFSGFSYRPCSLVLLACPLHCQIPCCSPMFEGSRSEYVVDRGGRMLRMDGMGCGGSGEPVEKRDKNKNTRADEKPLPQNSRIIFFMCSKDFH